MGSRPASENASERLKQLPILLHPPSEMSAAFIAKFIAESPEEFEYLRSLLRAEQDLASEMRKFEQFLTRSGFDRRYSWAEVFGALCKAARR
jgi:hypothetical protein